MAFTNVGFDGTVDEYGWTRIHASGLARYSVGGSYNHFLATVGGGGDRAITISAGDAWGKGVATTSDAPVVKNHASVTSGVRYDMIVLRRNRSTNSASIEIVTGTSARALPSRQQWSSVNATDDQPLWLVRVTAGSTVVAIEADLRVWNVDGIGTARSELVKDYLNFPGTELVINGVRWTRVMWSTSPTWISDGRMEINHTFNRNTSSTRVASAIVGSRLSWCNGIIQFRVVYTVASLIEAANIGNRLVGAFSLPSALRPYDQTSATSQSAGPSAIYHVETNGELWIDSLGPGNMAAGGNVDVGGMWQCADSRHASLFL